MSPKAAVCFTLFTELAALTHELWGGSFAGRRSKVDQKSKVRKGAGVQGAGSCDSLEPSGKEWRSVLCGLSPPVLV